MDTPYLSIIIPVYNEERRLSIAFSEINSFAQTYAHMNYEIIFVNDGSVDKTQDALDAYACEHANVRLVSYKDNKGKGHAVRKGMLEAKGEYRLMADADMSTSLFEIEQFLPLMKEHTPIIIGTRKNKGAVLVKKQPWYRQGMGDIYGFIARMLTGVRIKDFGCGFKAFSARTAEDIFSKTIIDGWIFDTEVLYVARRMSIPFKEVGVHWKNDEDTRVRLFTDAFRSVIDLLRMVIHHYRH